MWEGLFGIVAWLLWYPRIHSKFTSPKFCFLWFERIARTWKNSTCSSRLNRFNTSRPIRTHTKFVLTLIFPSVVKPLAGCFRSYHDTWIYIDAISYIRIATWISRKKPFQQNLHRKLHQPNQPTNQPIHERQRQDESFVAAWRWSTSSTSAPWGGGDFLLKFK